MTFPSVDEISQLMYTNCSTYFTAELSNIFILYIIRKRKEICQDSHCSLNSNELPTFQSYFHYNIHEYNNQEFS